MAFAKGDRGAYCDGRVGCYEMERRAENIQLILSVQKSTVLGFVKLLSQCSL